ncbi:MAG: carbamoyl-phosphate-synthetase [Micrococcales bacterium]|nr:carbamoyl-phosphate-synthetase [Micrococcales bacterium]
MPQQLTVLVANRGEIAVRIIRAAADLGWRTVAVFAHDERDALHTRLADEAHQLTGEGAAAYLEASALVEIARRSGATIVAPGYGFLSESAGFAAACEAAGLAFAGPTPEQLARFGDKAAARRLAQEQDVPVLPATDAAIDQGAALDFARSQPHGVMVKAVAGGGGRGMRPVTDPGELVTAMERAGAEVQRSFGSGQVYLERLLPRARHVEVQIIGDGSGAVTHLGDRDCSLQRRRQKLIEIAPAPHLPEDLRATLHAEAVRLGAALDYRGLGTVEFLLDVETGEHFFIEANPRLQVEHTVTEEVTGIDLVAASLRLAAGETLAELGLEAAVPTPRGTALQCRVNAETLTADGSPRPSAGTLARFEPPSGPGVRVDTGVTAGVGVGAAYDSLVAKVVTHLPGGELEPALAKAARALGEFRIEGVHTNLTLLQAILRHPTVTAGEATTDFVDSAAAALVAGAGAAAPATTDDHSSAATVSSELTGTVVEVTVAPGSRVRPGETVAVVEAMKMEHLVTAQAAGVVGRVVATAGDAVTTGSPLVVLDLDMDQSADEVVEIVQDLDEVRADLQTLRDRRQFTLDEARPAAVAKRHAQGSRTARENIADLVDEGSFVEYGGLVVAAQRQRRSMVDLIANTPADGIITGIGRINGDTLGQKRSRAAVLAYDYTVLAGTQGMLNHRKTDRLLELALDQRLPVVLFAEGGGGRPGDTDGTAVAGLDLHTFSTMGRLSGSVPTVGIVNGRCFAGNAALLGCCDVVIATRSATIGMGGPAMIEGGGLGRYAPDEVGPVSVQAPNGVIDVVVEDEAEAVDVARRYLAYFQDDGQGEHDEWQAHDERELRFVVPENRVRAYDVRRAVELIADVDSVLELRRAFGQGIVTALVRIEGRPMGLIANNPEHLGGAIDADSADKCARFLQLCDAHGLPVVSLCDTPGFMVGPDAERTATVRHFARLFVIGGNLSVPIATVVLRKGYGLGAMAMAAGSFASGAATVAWPTGEIGGMGLEGAVRLGFSKELAAAPTPAAQKELFDRLLADLYERGRAVNAAAVAELDDVIDPAETRRWLTTTLGEVRPDRERAAYIDTW